MEAVKTFKEMIIMESTLLFVTLAIILIIFLYLENNQLKVTTLNVESDKIPDGFDGYKIVHLSDLHNKRFGKNQHRILSKINALQPDVIFITGDIIDRRRYHPEISMELVKGLTPTYPVYYVTGNHERYSYRFDEIEEELNKYHVHILRNSIASITKDGQKINIIGIDDPSFAFDDTSDDEEREGEEELAIENTLHELKENVLGDYNILLAHRPEFFSIYAEKEMDLTFSGHAHGGQIIIPGIGGILAPSQGFFPKYTQGLHYIGDSALIVSRGLGNSLFPQRLFNKPEIITVTLSHKK